MAWIEYHENLRDFWKIHRLADKLQVRYNEALGLVSSLWLWAVSNAKDGSLKHFSDAEIARAANWLGEVNGLVGYLQECRLLDADKRIHDWHKHGTRLRDEAKSRKIHWEKRQQTASKPRRTSR